MTNEPRQTRRSDDRSDVAWEIAEHVVRATYADLGDADINATRGIVLDTLATLVGGSAEPPFADLVEFYVNEGGRGEASVMVHGARLPARNAVTLNSAIARALDLDDAHEQAIVHTGVHVVPAALAIAERQGGISGKDLMVAIALGQDLMIRLSLACETPPILRGRPGTYVFGTFATAVVTAKLLRLGVEGVVDALGNAFTRSAGTTLGYHDGALAQRLLQGLSASDGVLAGLLAERGIGGIRNCFEGDAGYFALHEGGRFDRAALTSDLGREFHGTATALKLYPVHRGAILDIEAALAAATDPTFDVSQIVRVVMRYPARFESGHRHIGAFASERADPKGPVEPHFSNTWAVGVALAQGFATVDDFTEAGVDRLRARVVPIARTVVGVPDQTLDRECIGLGPRVIDVELRNGTVITRRVDHASGGPDNPLRWAQIVQKLHDCATRAASPLGGPVIDRVVAMIAALEDIDDAARIPSALA